MFFQYKKTAKVLIVRETGLKSSIVDATPT